MALFTGRTDAGHKLVRRLQDVMGRDRDVVVLALPRGGVPVAVPVARATDAPLDVIGVRKLGAPGRPELGVGAVDEGGGMVLDGDRLAWLGLTTEDMADTIEMERRELRRRVSAYRGDRPLPDLADRTVVLVDDGLATGVTATAAVRAVREQGPGEVVVAVPVCAEESRDALSREADHVICVASPEPFGAVGMWYDDFRQTTDEEVIAALRDSRGRGVREGGPLSAGRAPHVATTPVHVTAGAVELEGDLTIPDDAGGVVVFAHGSGSSRRSPRNRGVAADLHRRGLGTLLFDLLTEEEERVDDRTRQLRFDIGLLAARLVGVTAWLKREEATSDLDVAYFGASTGAAAALVAAADAPDEVAGVVSRGGRPDLAADALGRVRAPTLLIVGGKDPHVLELNRRAAGRLGGEVRLEVVPGATHLFGEPGALERVSHLAGDFLVHRLAAGTRGEAA